MLENAVYSVITPEGCAAILWKDAAEAPKAAKALRLTAKDLLEFGLVDRIIEEPNEWRVATQAYSEISVVLKESILQELSNLNQISEIDRKRLRYDKFRKMGQWI